MRARADRWLAALAAGTALALVAGAAAQEGDHRADTVLAEAKTLEELSRLAGARPTRCLASAPGEILCEWELGKREAGWKPIADALDTRDRVRLLCELPDDGEPREVESCTAHVQRSDRDRWMVPVDDYRREEKRAAKRRSALGELEQARTLAELSRLVGAAPDGCSPQGPDEQVCIWRATARHHGHGILAMSIGVSLSKKVRMHCVLPTDGTARRWESCVVEVGA